MGLNITSKSNPFGDTTAENDKKMLSNAFIETADFRTLIETDDRTIVVGRRGTGKSALFIQLNEHWKKDKKILILSFSPDDSQIIGFRSMLKPFTGSFNLARAATRLLWRYAMLMEIASYISSHYKLSSQISSETLLNEHLKKWNSAQGDILRKCRLVAKEYLDENNPEESIGDLQFNLNISEIENNIVSLLERSDRKVVILMDKLDEAYEPDNIGIGIIAGLAYASIELNQKAKCIRPIIFLRDNIFRSLSKEDPDYSRNIEGQVIRLHWDWAQLLMLSAKRMKVAFKLDIEKDQRVWDRCTADDLKGRNGFKRCLQFTLYRPRDLLSLLNEAFFSAFRENRETIINTDLEYAAKSISMARLEDLWKEYQKIFPSIQVITSAFRSIEPELTVYTCLKKIEASFELIEENGDPKITSEIQLLKASGILQSLYSVGFVGIRDKNTSSYSFCHDGRTPDKGFESNEKLLIHPCYWLGLNLNRNALAPEEAEEINDEYDINIISDNSAIRNKTIGQITTHLDQIPIGNEGATEFEQWCLDALRIVFASHLTDIKSHPNGNAVQRRDIIGTNGGKSDFWKRVLEDYKTRQVVFDAKNFEELGPSEYRQLQSYLTGPYGKLDFIINRDESEVLKSGKDLDWTKEMYQSHNSLIIKLPAKYISKLLQKLRNPEKHDAIDRQMGKLLTLYETSYMAIKSTQKKRRK
ncbi:TPA: ATP-binding protein [Escherichia coli]|nr:ATP-binding protein [Escherichia coli]